MIDFKLIGMEQKTPKTEWSKRKIRKFLGPALVIMGLGYTYHSHLSGCPRQVILGGWAMGPPIWFIIEYWFFFDAKEEDLQLFKHYQSLGRNLWVGFLTFLAAFYLGDWN